MTDRMLVLHEQLAATAEAYAHVEGLPLGDALWTVELIWALIAANVPAPKAIRQRAYGVLCGELMLTYRNWAKGK